MGDTWINEVRVKLAKLATLDSERRVFGADAHNYQLLPPIASAAVERFERANDVALPADYRSFITRVANGGAGPVYGLAPLEPWQPEDFGDGGRPADPSMPFMLDQAWSPYDEDGNENPPPGPDDANPYDGCVFLAEIGCGYFYFLVVNGERAGQVWADYTAGDGELCQVFDSFRGWYDSWLDAELAEQLLLQVHSAFAEGVDWQADDDVLAWRQIFERRVEQSGENPRALENLAYLRIYERRDAEAAALIERLTDAHPESEALDDLRYLMHRKDIDAASAADTTTDDLSQYADSAVDEVRRAAAANPNTPSGVIGRLIKRALEGGASEREQAIDLELYARHLSLHPEDMVRLVDLATEELSWMDAVVCSVARHVRMPRGMLEQLATDAKPWVRESAASNDIAAPEMLATMANDVDVMVRRAVALHPGTAPEVLSSLAADPDEQVRACVAGNAHTPEPALNALAKSGMSPILQQLADNPNLPATIAECLAYFSNSWVRRVVASHPNLPPLVRRQLARDPDSDVRVRVTLAPDVDEVTMRLLLSDDTEEVRAAAAVNPSTSDGQTKAGVSDQALLVARARNPHTSAEELAELARHPISHVREAVAQNLAAPDHVLAVLADDELMFVRDAVPVPPRQAPRLLRQLLADPRGSSDPHVPVIALAELATKEDDLVPYAVAAHPWAPAELLIQLSEHRYSYTRMRVAEHAHTPVAVLATLSCDDAPMVRAAVARNPEAPGQVIEQLAEDPEDTVREAVALRPGTSRAVLDRLVADPDKYARRGICRNPAAPAELLEKLVSDPDRDVREWLVRRHSLPAPLLQTLADDDETVARAARYRQLADALE